MLIEFVWTIRRGALLFIQAISMPREYEQKSVEQNIVFNNCPLLFVIALEKYLRKKTGR